MATEHAASSAREVASTAVYVYGVGRADAVSGGGSGIGGSPVEPVVHKSLAAITGEVRTPVRARRRDLLLHSEVLQQQFASGTVLPLRFGTVFHSTHAVTEELLKPRYDELVRQLDALAGSVELSVRGFYVEAVIFEEIVRESPAVARLRAAARDAPAASPLSVRLGEAVAGELAARRDRDADEIVATLVPLARDVVTEERRAELEVLRSAFLVESGDVATFDARMNDLARRHDGRIVFKYVGPLPPHSFVRLEER